MRRRELLHLMACAVPACTAAGRVFAAPPGSPRFLLVFLRGGYDCANILIPYSSAYYYETRPNIAVRRPTDQDTGGALALDSDWALAPALRSSVALLYAQRQALFIPFAGTEDLSRSHFETQDDIELGQAASGRVQGSPDLRSGFMARLAGVVNGAAPIAFTDSLPVCFRGSADIPNISLKGVGRLVFDARQAAILSAMSSSA